MERRRVAAEDPRQPGGLGGQQQRRCAVAQSERPRRKVVPRRGVAPRQRRAHIRRMAKRKRKKTSRDLST
eukprot:6723269-Prymnesium_polylepis.1